MGEKEIYVKLTQEECYIISQMLLNGAKTIHDACPQCLGKIRSLGLTFFDLALPPVSNFLADPPADLPF